MTRAFRHTYRFSSTFRRLLDILLQAAELLMLHPLHIHQPAAIAHKGRRDGLSPTITLPSHHRHATLLDFPQPHAAEALDFREKSSGRRSRGATTHHFKGFWHVGRRFEFRRCATASRKDEHISGHFSPATTPRLHISTDARRRVSLCRSRATSY